MSHKKKNEIRPFAATWMDPEVLILSKVRWWKTNIIWYPLHVESKKRIQMNLLAEQTRLLRLWKIYGYQRGQVGGGWNALGLWDWHMHTEGYGTICQQGPAVWHRELYPIFCDNLCGEIIWKRMDVRTCITESLCYTAEMINPPSTEL